MYFLSVALAWASSRDKHSLKSAENVWKVYKQLCEKISVM